MTLIVGLAVWQYTSPQMIPPVGNRYSTSTLYANRGNWILLETMSQGRVFIAISISNLTFPRTWMQTTYSLIISDVNDTVSASYLRGFGLKVTAVSIQDNYDGSTSSWGRGNLTDAAQAESIFHFRTSTVHELRFTVSYQLYDLFLIGYVADHVATQSFNITQSVV